MKKLIPREYYLRKVEPFIGKDLIKVIVGQRRVGKSYFLLQIMELIKRQDSESNIIYINKELYDFDEIKDYHDLVRYVKDREDGQKKNSVFIDEIQDIKRFEKALRSFQAEGKYDIYCTGSNANLLSSDLATYLSGRYIEMRIFSLSYPEFLKFHEIDNQRESLLKYIRYGGLPYLVNLPLEDNVVYDYLKNVYNTILLKDVVARYQIRNISFLQDLVKFLADNVGNLYSAKKISDYLKSQKINISTNVILNYLNHLAAAFFINKVPRTDIIGKKIFEFGEKVYFEDLGLRHTIIGYHQRDINKVLENLVFTHLMISGFDVTVGKLNGHEIDFVCIRGNEKIYIQVVYQITEEKTWDREFGNLLQIKDNYPKIVVSMDEMIGAQYEGISHIHLLNFLSEYR